jgi:hypothetical protein
VSRTAGLCGGRNDDLDESGLGVVDQTRHEQPVRKCPPEDVDVDPDRRVRVADELGVEVGDRDPKDSEVVPGVVEV